MCSMALVTEFRLQSVKVMNLNLIMLLRLLCVPSFPQSVWPVKLLVEGVGMSGGDDEGGVTVFGEDEGVGLGVGDVQKGGNVDNHSVVIDSVLSPATPLMFTSLRSVTTK